MIKKEIIKDCKKHGITTFTERYNGRFRCKKCSVDSVILARQRQKAKLVELHGGKCKICGYNKCQQALQFHHIKPEEKSYGISDGVTRSLDSCIKESNKCVLLCANCHAEIEAGIIKLGC